MPPRLLSKINLSPVPFCTSMFLGSIDPAWEGSLLQMEMLTTSCIVHSLVLDISLVAKRNTFTLHCCQHGICPLELLNYDIGKREKECYHSFMCPRYRKILQLTTPSSSKLRCRLRYRLILCKKTTLN